VVIVTEKSDPITVNSDTWDFPYNYQLQTNGTVSSLDRDVLISGDFTVRVQRDNFAKYALFTNRQTLPNGTNVWFTSKTDFSGPIHTNGRYNIYGNPSGVFDGLVAQYEKTARYYNNGSPVLLNANYNGVKDVPTFNAGFNRGVSAITLTSPVQKQDLVDQATGGQSFSSNGIYVPNNGTSLTGGIFVKGNGTISLSVDGNDNPVYTISDGTTNKKVTVNYGSNQTTVLNLNTSQTNTYTGIPDGIDNVGTIIFVDGNITNLQGTIQKDTEITISSDDNITIENDLTYQNFTPAVGNPGDVNYVAPHATDAKNLLGLVSWTGSVYIGNNAPDDVNVHATVLSAAGIFQVDDYGDQGVGPRGVATLLGGAITDSYGAFGLFNSSNGQLISGYGRNFIYDQRMLVGNAPPYFPTLNTFIAFTNDITDKMVWQEGDI